MEQNISESITDEQLYQIGISDRFAAINRLITRDLNNYRDQPKFYLHTKEEISRYIANPYRYEKQLRDAINYIYAASPHFRRLIQYFTGLTSLAYVVGPYKIDPRKANVRTTNINYRRVLNTLSSMSIQTQFPKIISTCLRNDIFYGTMWETPDSITIQALNPDYCRISCIEDNVFNVTFDFSFFVSREAMLDYYPPEFRHKYETIFKREGYNSRWIELDAPTSFAIKCTNDILDYAVPPFAGLLREIYDIEDYKQMKGTKTAIENYAMLAMKIPMTEDGAWGIDFDKAKDFWRNLDHVLPDEVGSVLTPMDIDKISFEKSNTGDSDTVTDAENSLFTAAGVSSLLFNNTRASANALLLSIKVDQQLTFGIVKSIEDMVNRYIHYRGFGKYFKVTFLDCSIFNRDELGDSYLKAASYGLPTISMYSASQGLGQAELDNMSFLETKVLGLQDMFRPIVSSSQMNGNDADNEGGRPQKDGTELTDSGEQSREDGDDW